jgi:AcrR family transcriptional regulator
MPEPVPQDPRKRLDPRGAATRTALIEAAESLFAEAGVQGVSTRQIGAAIGSSNTNVVAYHFGSKDALIREVYRHRLPAIDQRRGALLVEADACGRTSDAHALVRVFFLPLYEQTDGAGRQSYARFLSGLERSGMIATRLEVNAEFPETLALFLRLRDCLPEAARPAFAARMRLVTVLMTGALHLIDLETDSEAGAMHALFEDAVAMAAAALVAPVPQDRTMPKGEDQ